MTPATRDFDDLLRRALHAEVDSIEPAEGGLDRIRRRTSAPWLVRQVSLMLTECVDLVRLIGIRLEPWFAAAWAAITARGGARAASPGRARSLTTTIRTLVAPRRRTGAHGSDSSSLAWLRPALAVGAAVVIVVAGVYALAQVRDNLVLELFPSSSAPPTAPAGPGSTGPQGPTLQQQSQPGVIPPSGSTSARPSPKPTCSRTTNQQAAAPTPTVSVVPTPTVSTDPSPSVVPTDTVTPTPTDTSAGTSAGTGAVPAAATVNVQNQAQTAPSTTAPCTQSSKASSPAG
jgi:hypothetical protein